MNTWARKSLNVGVLSAGVLLFAGGAANAGDLNSAGNIGILNGNQANLAVQAPIDICGNGVGVVGVGGGECAGGSWANLGADATPTLNSFGNIGIGNGNQIAALIQAPIDVCGNGVGVIGAGWGQCVGGSTAQAGSDALPAVAGNTVKANHVKANHVKANHVKANKKNTESAHVTEGATLNSFGNIGIANGNQVAANVQIPVDVCGNAISVLGAASASCVGGSWASATSSDPEGAPVLNSGFNVGILNGNQVAANVQIPVDVCGNAVGVLGAAQASCVGGASATTGGGNGGNGGNVYGGAPGIEGAQADHMMQPASYGPNVGGSDTCSPVLNSFGNIGIGNGNQVAANVQIPVEVSGNAVGVLGVAQASSVGGAWATC